MNQTQNNNLNKHKKSTLFLINLILPNSNHISSISLVMKHYRCLNQSSIFIKYILWIKMSKHDIRKWKDSLGWSFFLDLMEKVKMIFSKILTLKFSIRHFLITPILLIWVNSFKMRKKCRNSINIKNFLIN